jgi:hypothetical protein
MEIGGAPGPTSRFFWQLLEAATGATSASNRATTGMAPTFDYIYPQRKGARRNCGGWRDGGVNLA